MPSKKLEVEKATSATKAAKLKKRRAKTPPVRSAPVVSPPPSDEIQVKLTGYDRESTEEYVERFFERFSGKRVEQSKENIEFIEEKSTEDLILLPTTTNNASTNTCVLPLQPPEEETTIIDDNDEEMEEPTEKVLHDSPEYLPEKGNNGSESECSSSSGDGFIILSSKEREVLRKRSCKVPLHIPTIKKRIRDLKLNKTVANRNILASRTEYG